jgi:hypothetical protein
MKHLRTLKYFDFLVSHHNCCGNSLRIFTKGALVPLSDDNLARGKAGQLESGDMITLL